MTSKRKPKSRRTRANGRRPEAPAADKPANEQQAVGPEGPPAAEEPTELEAATAEDLALETDETGTFIAPQLATDESTGDGADEAADGGVALNSLQRLENDIQELHSRWADVESELATRYMEIASLEEDNSVQRAALEALQAEVDEGEIREQGLQAQLQSRNEQLDELQATAGRHADELAARDELVDAAEGKRAELQAQIEASAKADQELQGQLDTEREKYADSLKEIAGLKSTIADRTAKIADLETYIDGRKSEWERQTTDLEQYRDTLAEMERKLQGKVEAIGKEKDANTTLSAEIASLETRCAELDGRRAERELANQELQDRLTERAADIEALRHELRDAERASAPLQSQLDESQAQLEAARADTERLQSELDELRRDTESNQQEARASADSEMESMRATLESARADGEELQSRLTESEKRIDELQGELAKERGEFKQVMDVAQANEARLASAIKERDKLQAEIDRMTELLEEMDSEFREYRDATAIDLEASVQRSAELEQQLEERNAALRSLDRNVDMMNKINATVERLDNQISASQTPPVAEAGNGNRNGKGRSVRRLMVALHGHRKVRYPLYKDSMTIGRSRDADIQVRQKWISRKHARILVDDNTVTIEDLGSKNGILINNKAVHAGELHNEDVVEIGDTQFQFIDLMDRP